MKTLITSLVIVASAGPAFASVMTPAEMQNAKCEKDFSSFEEWKNDFHKDATAAGISENTWNQADSEMIYDQKIVDKDSDQHGFYTPFIVYAGKRVSERVGPGKKYLAKFAPVLSQIQAKYGIPPEVLITLWGMESSFTTPTTNLYPILTSASTLAYNCRRPALFRENLLGALHLIENGELTPDQLMGQWAGEMSGMQFTPANYWDFGVDFDHDGRRDPVGSRADMFATGAAMLKSYGWKPGQPYLIEVRVPESMNWADADLTATKMLPVREWQRRGVTLVNGGALPYQNLPAALMLPMGRLGPAFIAFENFHVFQTWNSSINNALTIGYLASRIGPQAAPPISPGRGQVNVLSKDAIIELQKILAARGYNIGKIDGMIGGGTRDAVKDMQIKMGWPADAYPTEEFLAELRQQ